jgi:anti-anti-sigma factor
MDIAIDRIPGVDTVELVVRGRLDAECAGELQHAVAAELRQGFPAVTLDLAAVPFLSSAGIRVLFDIQRATRAAGGDCRITVASEPVRKVLELTRLDRILMQPAAVVPATAAAPATADPPSHDIECGTARLLRPAAPAPTPLVVRRHGTTAALRGTAGGPEHERVPLPAHSFALGIGAVADDTPAERTAGEMVAAGGAVYHRAPRPFAAVDYLLGTGDLVAAADLVTGLSWEGIPGGRAAFEPAGDATAVGVDDLAAALLRAADAEALVVVIAGEVQGLVAAELIRPLAEVTPADHPHAGTRAAAVRWLCFSREPIHAGRTAVVVGVVTRTPAGPLADLVAPLGPGGLAGHLHAVVFPHRPLRRAAGDLATVIADLTASEPVAVVHLMADDRPVLGTGVSGLVRGCCWFAPLACAGDDG